MKALYMYIYVCMYAESSYEESPIAFPSKF